MLKLEQAKDLMHFVCVEIAAGDTATSKPGWRQAQDVPKRSRKGRLARQNLGHTHLARL